MKANEVAKILSNGKPCEFWLTKKQASWLLYRSNQEGVRLDVGYGKRGMAGVFEVDGKSFAWDANEGSHGSALLSVREIEEQNQEDCNSVSVDHPVYQYAIANGYNWNDVVGDIDLQMELLKIVMGERNV